jgi:C-terminal processing protease CtpA/Prc
MKLLDSNGSRFQNIGVIPDVFVEPTIAGVAAGRDEVLEKGVETVNALIKQRSAVTPK